MMRISETLDANRFAVHLPNYKIEHTPDHLRKHPKATRLRLVATHEVRQTERGKWRASIRHAETVIAYLSDSLDTSIDMAVGIIDDHKSIAGVDQIHLYIPHVQTIHVLQPIKVERHMQIS